MTFGYSFLVDVLGDVETPVEHPGPSIIFCSLRCVTMMEYIHGVSAANGDLPYTNSCWGDLAVNERQCIEDPHSFLVELPLHVQFTPTPSPVELGSSICL